MSLVTMSKIRLVGLKAEKEKLLGVLTDCGCFESFSSAALVEEGSHSPSKLDSLLTKLARVRLALKSINSFLDEEKKFEKALDSYSERFGPDFISAIYNVTNVKDLVLEDKTPARKGRIELKKAEFLGIKEKEEELLATCEEIEEHSFSRTELDALMSRLSAETKQIAPYKSCKDTFSAFRSTETSFSKLVLGRNAIKCITELSKIGAVVIYDESPSNGLIGFAGLLTSRDEFLRIVSENSLTVCPLRAPFTAEEMLAEKASEIKENRIKYFRVIREGAAYKGKLDELKIYADYLSVEIDKAKAEDELGETDSVFVLDGWVPAEKAESISSALKKESEFIKIWISEVDAKKDKPPTLYKDNKVLMPYQALGDSYSPPSYFETDPSPIMALFFFIFYGVMTADVGYGIILTVGALLFAKFSRPEKGMLSLVLLIGYSSISTIIWGVLFGSVFGLSFNEIGASFGIMGLPDKIWFNPMDEPIRLMLLSLMFGAAHIMVGYAIHMYENIRNKRWTDAFFDDLFLIVTYVGVFILILWIGNPVSGMFKVDAYPEAFDGLLNIGLIVMGSGLVGTVLTKGRREKPFFMKIIIGLSGLYGIVNILSDVLSYARIFGLTIASCAIAFAFNIIIGMIGGFGPIGFAAAIIIAIALHAFNMAMGVLSAYVHNARLQYLEFYGKFYIGEGKLFSPLGSHTEYVSVVD